MLTIVVGPMFSGKSSSLHRYVSRALRSKKTVKVFVPVIDVRSKGQITTHNGMSLADLGVTPTAVTDSQTIYQSVKDNPPGLLVIDEAQFFDPQLPQWVEKLSVHTHIVAAGLDMTSEGIPFTSPMGDLLCLADQVIKLTAICQCGGEATRTACLVEKVGSVLVGGVGQYVPMCRGCWDVHRAQ